MTSVAKIFVFVKDDQYLMSAWIPYHAKLVGMSNLYIVDHDSSPECQEFYQQYIELGLNHRVVKCSFRDKGRELTKWMQEVRSECTWLIAIDSDEFIVTKNQNEYPICDTDIVNESLTKLPLSPYKQSFFICLAKCNCFSYDDPLVEMTSFHGPTYPTPHRGNKTFWPSSTFISTDEGNHCGTTSGDNSKYIATDLGTLHFPRRGFYQTAAKCIRGKKQLDFDKKFVGVAAEWRANWNELISGKLEQRYKTLNYPEDNNMNFATQIVKIRQAEFESGRHCLQEEKWNSTKAELESMKNDNTLKPAVRFP